MHGFTKSCSSTSEMFQNDFFQRDHVELETRIRRKNLGVIEAATAPVSQSRSSKRSRAELEELQDQVKTLEDNTRQLESRLAAAEASNVLQQAELFKRQKQLEKMSAAWSDGVRNTQMGIGEVLDSLRRYRFEVSPTTTIRHPERVEDVCICSMLGGDPQFCVCMVAVSVSNNVYGEECVKGGFSPYDNEF